VNRSRRKAFGNLGGTNDGSPVIEHLDQVILFDSSFFGIFRIYPDNPVVIAINQNPVVFNVIYKAILAISMGVEAEAGVGGY
jgi:hypothetical protein